MSVDWRTAMQTPFSVVMKDIEMMGLENKWGPKSITADDLNSSGGIQPGIIRHSTSQL